VWTRVARKDPRKASALDRGRWHRPPGVALRARRVPSPVVVDETKARGGGAQSLLLAGMLLLGGLLGMVLVGVGCEENLRPGSTRAGVCGRVGEPDEPDWWLAAVAPLVAFLVVRRLARRRSTLRSWATVAIAAAAFVLYAILTAVVTGNL
jgi:hypothetical protein